MAGVGRGLVAVVLAFLVLFASPAAAAAARGMARTEAQARAAYDLWLARHGKASRSSQDTVEALLRFPAKRQRGSLIAEELVDSVFSI
ncbi:hypothetical protein C2845_PM15G24950 [Panicum miliaceum]|uniref:Uncharacterized protein n=1 Tax=Panicum miliaceum TaxID=4540 RepID=A0A3L6Q4F1_PANMI|nr:hypothetical protein C2845_PM15G24950 [Panicum miliaceum]